MTGISILWCGTSLRSPSPGLPTARTPSAPWFWGDPANPAAPAPWATGVSGEGGQPLYPAGNYAYWAESQLNGLKENYRQGGAEYTGKTVSQPNTVSLVSGDLQIQINRDPVQRGERFSVTITGDRNTPYYLWVENTGTM